MAILPRGSYACGSDLARIETVVLFAALTLNSDWEKLGGPCPRCDQYFIRKTAKQIIYCARRCATQATAIEATIRAREEERREKLERAKKAQAEWQKRVAQGREKKGWKEFVNTREPDITAKFLTRAVNNGELFPPAINSHD